MTVISLFQGLTLEQAFTPLALFLCLLGSLLSNKRAIGLIFFANLCFFELIYYFNLHLDVKYYLLALMIDLLIVRLFLRVGAPRFLILLLSLSVLYNGLSYLGYEILGQTFIFNYYIAVMKAVIILSVLSIFTDGCLDALDRKRNNDRGGPANDIGSFHPRSFRASKGVH